MGTTIELDIKIKKETGPKEEGFPQYALDCTQFVVAVESYLDGLKRIQVIIENAIWEEENATR